MKKTLLTLLGLIVLMGGAMAWFVNRTPATPFADAPPAQPSPDLAERGAYVARAADCVACHSAPGGEAFAGGLEMATPLGSIFATNITPDPATGIGRYTLADFDRADRKGVARDGHRLYPAMLYPSYAKLKEDDIRALYAYFMTEVTPRPVPNRQSEIPGVLGMRWPLAVWNAKFAPSETFAANPGQSDAWNRRLPNRWEPGFACCTTCAASASSAL